MGKMITEIIIIVLSALLITTYLIIHMCIIQLAYEKGNVIVATIYDLIHN